MSAKNAVPPPATDGSGHGAEPLAQSDASGVDAPPRRRGRPPGRKSPTPEPSQTASANEILSAAEAAALLQLDVARVRSLHAKGVLPGWSTSSRHLVFVRSQIVAFVERQALLHQDTVRLSQPSAPSPEPAPISNKPPSPASSSSQAQSAWITTDELAERIRYDPRTIRTRLMGTVLIEGVHYFRPFGGRKILFVWEAVQRDLSRLAV